MKYTACFVFVILFVDAAAACTIEISTVKTNAVYGRVIDEMKASIPNARIRIFKSAESNDPLAETTSDENGRFEIKNFPAGVYIIKANAENFAYTTSFLKLKKSSSKVKKREMVFTLVPSPACSGWVEMQKIQKSK